MTQIYNRIVNMQTLQLLTGLHQVFFGVLNSSIVVWRFCTRLFLLVCDILLSGLVPSWLLLLWGLIRWYRLRKGRLRLLIRWLGLLISGLSLRWHIRILRLLFWNEVLLWWLPLASWRLDDFVYVLLKFQVCHHVNRS